MRLIELFEGREETIAQRQGQAILSAVQNDDSAPQTNNPLDIVNQIAQIDKKAIQWLTNMYVRGQFKLEDISRLKNEIKLYNRVKPQLPPEQRDMNRFKTLVDLYNVIRPYEQQEPVSGKQQAKQKRKQLFLGGDAERIYQDQYLTVDIPKTEEASCELGKRTKWCTAAEKNNLFKRYHKKGPLYIISTRDGHKYQFHFETRGFKNELDQNVNVGRLVQKYPTLKDAFDKIAKKYLYLPLIKNITPEIALSAVKKDGRALLYVPPELQTLEIALSAVKKNRAALRYVRPDLLTPEVIISVVKQDGLLLKDIKPELQTPEIALAAVRENGSALHYVRPDLLTPEVELAAVEQNGLVLQIIDPKKQTPEIALAAVKQNESAFKYVSSDLITTNFILAAVKKSGTALMYINPDLQTPEIVSAAVEQTPYAINSVRSDLQSLEMVLKAVKRDGLVLVGRNTLQTPEIALAAVKQNGFALEYINSNLQTPEVALAAVKQIIKDQSADPTGFVSEYVKPQLQDYVRKTLGIIE